MKGNKDHQQCSLSLRIKSGITNLSLGQGTKQTYKPSNTMENHSLKRKWAQKLYNENVWHVNITKLIVIQFSCTSQLCCSPLWQNSIVFQSHLYPTLRPTIWFQISPPEIRYIVDGPYRYIQEIQWEKTVYEIRLHGNISIYKSRLYMYIISRCMHGFRYLFGAVKWQAIIWSNISKCHVTCYFHFCSFQSQ